MGSVGKLRQEDCFAGEVPKWSQRRRLEIGWSGNSGTWVRIPPSPPLKKNEAPYWGLIFSEGAGCVDELAGSTKMRAAFLDAGGFGTAREARLRTVGLAPDSWPH